LQNQVSKLFLMLYRQHCRLCCGGLGQAAGFVNVIMIFAAAKGALRPNAGVICFEVLVSRLLPTPARLSLARQNQLSPAVNLFEKVISKNTMMIMGKYLQCIVNMLNIWLKFFYRDHFAGKIF